MTSLEGRVALVTGAARGIGAAHVRALHDAGANVMIADILEEEGNRLADELGRDRTAFLRLDAASWEQWQQAIAQVKSLWGRLDILVNNAGITRPKLISEMSPDEWSQIMSVNLDGTFMGIKAAAGLMVESGGGAIVNTSSMMAHQPADGMGPYSASKSGVIALTRVAALELARHGIRVNSLHPGMIETPMTAGSDRDEVHPRIPMRRYGTPEEVAATMLFIVRDATYATGSEFHVNGGILAGRERSLSPAQ
ncbi:SDR family NAD(P)-dependent oxidoreductase [Ruicaihuangia caeni]|uniref:SDR family NAD(P)-dependent oxidoreductase n=1 Tax=Ruicaihuangia caeni TaxID=3042517 RepID=UPI00338E67FF